MRRSLLHSTPPYEVEAALKRLGWDLRTARLAPKKLPSLRQRNGWASVVRSWLMPRGASHRPVSRFMRVSNSPMALRDALHLWLPRVPEAYVHITCPKTQAVTFRRVAFIRAIGQFRRDEL
jgi:hypothetical protein